MPGKEIKGRSKIASYRHGGRAGYKEGKKVKVAGEAPELPGSPLYDTSGRIVGYSGKEKSKDIQKSKKGKK